MAAKVYAARRSQIGKINLTGKDAANVDQMICGGHMEVLLEFIPADPLAIRELKDFIGHLRQEPRGHLVKSWKAPSPKAGRVKNFLLQKGELAAGQFPGPDSCKTILAAKAAEERFPFLWTCEGHVFFVEPAQPSGTVFLFGAGHVSQQVARIAPLVDFRVVVLDDRSEFASAPRFPEADQIKVIPSFENCLQDLETGPDSYLIIVTRGHIHDKTVLEQALRTNAGYIGMIGSRRKRDLIYRELLAVDFTEKDLQRAHCPIGLDIGAETPEEIAVSITAELIQVRALKKS